MIVRIARSSESGSDAFIPLRFDAERGQWLPITSTSYESAIGAAEACLAHQLKQWRELHQQSQIVRALCEHPGFDFQNDGIDAGMVRTAARDLACQIEALDIELPRMLDGPGEHDQVPLDGILVEVEITTDPADN